jgi:hypothetical protein
MVQKYIWQNRKHNLPFLAAPRKNVCKEPYELVAAKNIG